MSKNSIKMMPKENAKDSTIFLERLQAFQTEFDRRFREYLTPTDDVPATLLGAIQYAALAPGKRIRPYLVIRCCQLAGGDASQAWPAAAAMECVHAFSLVHDDLPAMDDDDFRRGQPSTHKKFGEAVAILAGDALVVLAFELLTREVPDKQLATEMAAELAHATGWSGMIGGQTADVLGEGEEAHRELVEYIHQRKTARLFEAACRLGALAGGNQRETLDRLGAFGQWLGRAFQIADDLLDLPAKADQGRKNVRKDAKAGKQTFPQCVGIDKSRKAARDMAATAVAKLEPFGPSADDLRALTRFVIERKD